MGSSRLGLYDRTIYLLKRGHIVKKIIKLTISMALVLFNIQFSGIYAEDDPGVGIDSGPISIALTQDPLEEVWTNGDVTITATITLYEGETIVSAKWAVGERVVADFAVIASTDLALNSEGIGAFSVAANGFYTVYAKDNLDNEYVSVIEILNIDKIAPTITEVTGNPTSWTKEDVILTVTASDSGSGLAAEAYSFDNGATWQVSNQKTFTSNQTVNIKVKDAAGNVSEVENVSITFIDKINPTIDSVTADPTALTNGNVTLTVTASDGQSGIATSGGYSFDDGATWQDSNQKSFSTNQTVSIQVKDAVGNISSTTFSITNIVTDGPEIVFTPNGDTTPKKTQSTTVTLQATAPATITISEYQWTQSVTFPSNGTWTSFTSGQTISLSTGDGNWYLHVRATDSAGNNSTATSAAFVLDNTAPVTSATLAPTSPDGDNDWYVSNVTVTLAATDGGSGVATTEYNLDGSTTWLTYPTEGIEFTTDGNHTVYYRSTDTAGNIETTKTVSFKIDKTNPTITEVTGNPTSWTKEDVILTVTASDSGSGLAAEAYSFDNGATWQVSNQKTFTSNQTVNIKVKDAAGNVSEVENVSITFIDKINPTIDSVTADPTALTNGNVTLTVTASDGQSGIATSGGYSFDDGATWQDSNQKSFSTNQTVSIQVKDAVGNISSTTFSITNIVTDGPEIVFTPNGDTTPKKTQSTTVTLQATAPATITISEYQWTQSVTFPSNGTWTSFTSGQTISLSTGDGNWYLHVRATDSAGNNSTATSAAFVLDNTAPVTSATLAPTSPDGDNDWYVSNVTVTLAATDGGSGVATTEYNLDGSTTWLTYPTEGIEFTTDGNHTVYYRSTDTAGNIETTKTVSFKIDKTNPTKPSVTLSTESWTNQNVTATITSGTDALSGVNRTEYRTRLDGGTWTSWTTYSAPVPISAEGETSIEARTVDNAGNVSSSSDIEIALIDTTIPTTPSVSLSTGTWTNQNVTATITPGTDALSGVNRTEYRTRLDGGTWTSWTTYTAPVMIEDQGQTSIEARTIDNAGNTSESSVIRVALIDKTLPTTPSVSLSTETWTNQNVTATITSGTDALSGVNRTEYRTRLDGGTWTSWTTYTTPVTISTQGQTSIEARTIDNAGNVSDSSSIKTALIDTTIPTTPSVSLSTETWTNQNVTATITSGTDALSGVNRTEYRTRMGGGTWSSWSTYTAPVVISAEGQTSIEAITIDNAGNISDSSVIKTALIDKTGPTGSLLINAGDEFTNTPNVTLTLSASDLNNIVAYRVANGTDASTAEPILITPETPFETTVGHILSDNDGVKTVSVQYQDVAGNWSNNISSTITLLTSGPQVSITARKADNTLYIQNTWTNQNVSVSLVANDPNLVSFIVDGEEVYDPAVSLTSAQQLISVTSEGTRTITYVAKDAADNTNSGTFVVKIDRTNPNTTATLSPITPDGLSSWYVSDVTLTLSATDPLSGILRTEYSLNGTDWITYTSPVLFDQDGQYNVRYRSVDIAGNTETFKSIEFKLDQTAPTGTLQINGDDNFTNSRDVMLHLAATDLNGVIAYRVANGSDASEGLEVSIDPTDTFTDIIEHTLADIEGLQTVAVQYKDVAGNWSDNFTATITLLIEGPLVTVTGVKQDETQYLTDTWTNQNVSVTFTATDEFLTSFIVDGEEIDIIDFTATVTLNFEAEGTTSIAYVATDSAGNTTSGTFVVKIDKTSPNAPTVTLSNENWTNTAVIITITPGSDNLSGIKTIERQISTDGGDTWSEWTTYSVPFEISDAGITHVRARNTDQADNVSELSDVKIIRIDKTVPTAPSVTLSTEAWTNQNVTVTIASGTDGQSGVNRTEYRTRLNSGSWTAWTRYTVPFTISVEGQTEVVARTIDNAGNTSAASPTKTARIDKTAPIVSGVANNQTYTVDVTITFNEGTATLNGNAFTSGSKVTANGEYVLIVTDQAGNRTEVRFIVQKYILGDANGDGKVDISDLVMMSRMLAGLQNMTDIQRMAVDVNQDNKFDISDLVMLSRKLAGLE